MRALSKINLFELTIMTMGQQFFSSGSDFEMVRASGGMEKSGKETWRDEELTVLGDEVYS